MAVTTIEPQVDDSPGTGRARRGTAAAFVAGGLLMAVGGQLHPIGSGDTVEGHLLSMFDNPVWPLSHAISLVGAVLAALGLWLAWRGRTLGRIPRRGLGLVVLAWAFGAAEQVPHLLASGEAHALAHHEGTPLLDVHLAMQLVATPVVGLSGAALAVAVARAAATWPARLLAVPAVVGGVAYAFSAPLVVLTGDTRFTLLFPFQAGLALWLLGTGVRLWRR